MRRALNAIALLNSSNQNLRLGGWLGVRGGAALLEPAIPHDEPLFVPFLNANIGAVRFNHLQMRLRALPGRISQSTMRNMKRRLDFTFRTVCLQAVMLAIALAPARLHPEPTAAATAAFNSYVDGVEARLAQEHASADSILAPVNLARLRSGQFIVEDLKPLGGKSVGGALLQDWRGTAFVPGAKAADFVRLMKDFSAFPKNFAPQVLQMRVLSEQGNQYKVTMRVRQKHIITVVLDMDFDMTFTQADQDGAARGYIISRSTRVAEIEAPGTPQEHALAPNQDHGFLWRMNNYWSYEEGDGGLYIQIESVSLSRSVPAGIGWAVKPFIQSVPRESLEATLRSACAALRK